MKILIWTKMKIMRMDLVKWKENQGKLFQLVKRSRIKKAM